MGVTETINSKWLKSLKDRVQSKPSWSEEDRRMLIGLIDELDAIMNKATPNEISVYNKYTNWLKSLSPQKQQALPQWRRLPLSGISYAPDSWCVMDVITSTVGANSTSVSALVKGNYYVPLYELDKFINKEK